MTEPQHALPGPLRLPPASPFVGRARELARLRARVPRAAGECRRIALVGGEAGSGKSRLVREFARGAAADGAIVLYGACDAVVRTPYRPFADALDHLVRSTDPAVLRDDLGAAGGELSRLLPELAARVSGLPGPIAADPDTERHRLHTAVTDLLAATARRCPLVLVIEDGHWADAPTLMLLRHLARATAEVRVLVLATFRDTEAEVPADLADALADLRRSDDVVRMHLAGLTEDDVSEFVRRAGGAGARASGDELPLAIRDLTEGNPFLLCELWRALVEADVVAIRDGTVELTVPLSDIATPRSVREVVSQRLARLDETTGELLELAAVAGPEFELGVLRLAAPDELERLDALDPALRSGMIEELPAPSLAFRFTHELVRRAVYDRLSAVRRAELHLRIAEALEASGPGDSGRMLADLAHHFAAAAPIDGPQRAVTYNLRAAEAASGALDHGEAAQRLRTALEIGIDDDDVRRAEVLLELGGVLFRAGRSLDALQAYREAAEVARALQASELLARAAIGFETTCWRPGLTDQGARELLEEASAAFPEHDSTLRVGLLAGLARAIEFQRESELAREIRRDAIAMARRVGDRSQLALVLMGSYWARSTTDLDTIVAQLLEARDIGAEIGDIEIQAEAMEWVISARIARGEIGAARDEITATQRMAEHTRQPFILHVAEHYHSAIALLEGHLAEAEAAAERSREWGQLLTGRDASGVYGVQMFGVRREQGRLAELAPVVRVLAASGRDGAWRPGLAAMLAELGMHDEAIRELDAVALQGVGDLTEGLWLASMTYLADAASAVGHEPIARLVYDALAPLERTNVMIGHGVACYGSADRYLGMLAAVVSEHDAAAAHFEAALELNRQMGAMTWLAHTACEYGRLKRTLGDERGAGELIAQAAGLADSIGMPTLRARVAGLGSTVAPAPDGLSPREVDVLRLVARGLSNREVGTRLHISEHTAANHIRAILRKTGCANRTEAAAYAYRRRLTEE